MASPLHLRFTLFLAFCEETKAASIPGRHEATSWLMGLIVAPFGAHFFTLAAMSLPAGAAPVLHGISSLAEMPAICSQCHFAPADDAPISGRNYKIYRNILAAA